MRHHCAAGQEVGWVCLCGRIDDHADAVFAQFAEQAGGEFDIAAQENPGQRMQWHGADPLAVFSEDEGFAIDFQFDTTAVNVKAGHCFPLRES